MFSRCFNERKENNKSISGYNCVCFWQLQQNCLLCKINALAQVIMLFIKFPDHCVGLEETLKHLAPFLYTIKQNLYQLRHICYIVVQFLSQEMANRSTAWLSNSELPYSGQWWRPLHYYALIYIYNIAI